MNFVVDMIRSARYKAS